MIDPWLARRFTLLLSLTVLSLGLYEYFWTVTQLYGQLVIDDAFITYRYAENWASGLGPTWNLAEPPVEGYSNPFYMALLALAKVLLGVDVPGFSRLVGMASGLGTIAVLYLLVYRSTGSVRWGLVAAGVLAFNPHLAVWSVGGMETALYTLLITLSTLFVLKAREEDSRPRIWVGLGVILALTALTRTEGPVALGAFAVCVLLDTLSDSSKCRRLITQPLQTLRSSRWPGWAVATIVGVCVVIALHLLLRHSYYGLWFPLPVYEKSELLRQKGLVVRFLQNHWLFFSLWLPALCGLHSASVRSALNHSLFLIVFLGLVVMNVDGVMTAYDRYMFPVLPLIVFGATLGIRELLAVRFQYLIPALAFFGLVVVGQGERVIGASRDYSVRNVMAYSTSVSRSHVTLGKWLGERIDDPMVRMVASDCGVLPYYSRLRVIDFFGLNDRHIAMHGPDTDYIFDLRPELIVVSPHGRDKPLREDIRLVRDYTLVGRWPGFYTLELYRRKDYQLPVDTVNKAP